MANANNERSNDIRENVFNDTEKYYEQKYLQILKIQEQLMGSEHEKLLKDESFLDRIVWPIIFISAVFSKWLIADRD